ncbi:hypothetical protein PgNI_10146 [Pyricularia grisea]|uniref:Uncharacterized protein n=1 Tax=Pyricularia grisea TaxID=148305 RepID=A0A6P8AYG0_PYRGI|nr:hypothetical protein PgNI_10146 [Pyricularia grisea]TLD07316.1 hypothetical protein PgNI_10146 [Pyricularia grisea]
MQLSVIFMLAASLTSGITAADKREMAPRAAAKNTDNNMCLNVDIIGRCKNGQCIALGQTPVTSTC